MENEKKNIRAFINCQNSSSTIILIFPKIIKSAKVMSSPIITLMHLFCQFIFILPQPNSMIQRKCILFYIWFPVRDDKCQFHHFAHAYSAPSTIKLKDPWTVRDLTKLNNHHHHHHVVPLAQISLTLSRHFSLSFIASRGSSGQHPVSSHSCWMYVRAGRPAFARPYVGVHGSTSLMSSSLLL